MRRAPQRSTGLGLGDLIVDAHEGKVLGLCINGNVRQH